MVLTTKWQGRSDVAGRVCERIAAMRLRKRGQRLQCAFYQLITTTAQRTDNSTVTTAKGLPNQFMFF
jgi:hypothetical protein